MNSRDAKKIVSGCKVKYKFNQQIATVYSIDNGPGTDPRVAYPLFHCQFAGGELSWITYKLLKIV